MSNISDGFNAWMGQFQSQMDGNMKHLATFNQQLSELAKMYTNVRRDLERERVAGRHAQQLTETMEGKLRVLEESTMRGAFVLVLVDADADAYLFNDTYYTGDPAEGGERAAVDLKAAVQQYLKSVDPRLAVLPIMARAFASGEGLATLLVKAGLAKSGDGQQIVSRFTSGFSQADEMFDYVLVGKGKDRADHKLMGAFRQFVESPSCQHVLLASCHDNGYVRMLEKCIHNPAIVAKVTMVKSFQTGSEFKGLPFQSITLESVFRGRALGSSGGGSSPTNNLKPGAPNGVQTNGSPSPAIAPSSNTNKAFSPPATYASRAAGVPQSVGVSPASASTPIPVYGQLAKNYILVNAADHRVDMPLPPRSNMVAESFHRKMYNGGKRYCNRHHLYGPESCLGNCGYLHDALTASEKLVMRHKLRAERCLDRGKYRGARDRCQALV
ncbi:hypothetical protein C8A00DRAFT_31311 [Chaetomidium leptoderma]|uniref:DUF7923 domain-containing protein n=1 Tax=Chaetomidium leptoderma TaxID=669021 RepID=A0AAN6VQD1_9PEZI|nr:hypothetical protein C8A00DRAFT_31311 [Chaetomidium leptoderma]